MVGKSQNFTKISCSPYINRRNRRLSLLGYPILTFFSKIFFRKKKKKQCNVKRSNFCKKQYFWLILSLKWSLKPQPSISEIFKIFSIFQFSKISTLQKFEKKMKKKMKKKWKKFRKNFPKKKKFRKNFFDPKCPKNLRFRIFTDFYQKKIFFNKFIFSHPTPWFWSILVRPKIDIFFENFLVENIGEKKKSKMLTALTFFLEGVIQLALTSSRFRLQRLR